MYLLSFLAAYCMDPSQCMEVRAQVTATLHQLPEIGSSFQALSQKYSFPILSPLFTQNSSLSSRRTKKSKNPCRGNSKSSSKIETMQQGLNRSVEENNVKILPKSILRDPTKPRDFSQHKLSVSFDRDILDKSQPEKRPRQIRLSPSNLRKVTGSLPTRPKMTDPHYHVGCSVESSSPPITHEDGIYGCSSHARTRKPNRFSQPSVQLSVENSEGFQPIQRLRRVPTALQESSGRAIFSSLEQSTLLTSSEDESGVGSEIGFIPLVSNSQARRGSSRKVSTTADLRHFNSDGIIVELKPDSVTIVLQRSESAEQNVRSSPKTKPEETSKFKRVSKEKVDSANLIESLGIKRRSNLRSYISEKRKYIYSKDTIMPIGNSYQISLEILPGYFVEFPVVPYGCDKSVNSSLLVDKRVVLETFAKYFIMSEQSFPDEDNILSSVVIHRSLVELYLVKLLEPYFKQREFYLETYLIPRILGISLHNEADAPFLSCYKQLPSKAVPLSESMIPLEAIIKLPEHFMKLFLKVSRYLV